jgi:uncharacterized membrane protein
MRRPDLGLVAIGALLAWAAVLLLPPDHLVRVGLGLLLTTALPGYAASAALLGPRRVGGPDSVLLTLGLSLPIAILTGLLLDAFGANLSRETWAAALAIVTLIGVGVAWGRSPSAIFQASPAGQGSMPRLHRPDAVVLGLAGVLVVIVVALARNGVAQQPTEPFSSVWLVPNAAGTQVRVGVANHEGHRTTYRLVLASPTSTVQEWPAVTVEDGQQWEADLPIISSHGRLELQLYLADKPGFVYRTASWGAAPSVDPGTEASPGASGSAP